MIGNIIGQSKIISNIKEIRKRVDLKTFLGFLIGIALSLSSGLLMKPELFRLFPSAATVTNVLVEADKSQGSLSHPWQYLAQGGEEAEPMLDDIAAELKVLKPNYIRIDYIYNFYDVVGGKNNGKMTFNWDKLDQRIQDILNTGAKPLISLSYMPRVLTLNAVHDPGFEEGISGYVYNPPGAKVAMTKINSGYEGNFSLKLDNSAGTVKGYYFVEAGNKDGNLNDNIDIRYDWSVFVRSDDATSKNLVPDPSFENGISGNIYNPPGAQVKNPPERIAPGYEGNYSLKLINQGTADGYYFVEAGNVNIDYDWSAFVRADVDSPNGVGLHWHAGDKKYFPVTTNWQKILVNGKIGPEQPFNRWYVIIPPGKAVYIDNLSLISTGSVGLTWHYGEEKYFPVSTNWQKILVNGKIIHSDPFSRWYIIVPPGKAVYIDNLELTANPYNEIYDPTPPPYWHDWQEVVRATIEHYSGKNQKNLTDVYYEVWNEPQVFGGWSIDGSTLNDYRLIYKYAAQGAQETQNVNSFKFGGPSSVVADQGWMTTFFKFVKENNLRCDFISWHTYTDDPSVMARDVDNIDSWKAPFPNVTNAEKLITEWGSFAGMPPENDNEFSAAYSVVALRNLLEKDVKPFVFEIKDGPSNTECWGRWGMITHEKFGKHKKAEYNAFKTLSFLKPNRISLAGENDFLKGIASRDNDGSLAIILANYDKNKSHTERVSLNISGLLNGSYTYQEYLIDATHSNYCKPPSQENLEEIANERVSINQGSLIKTIDMKPNSVTLITLTSIPLPYQIITWEATDPALFHQTGRAEGTDWSANTAADGPGFLNFGPYYAGFEGGAHYRATWKLMIDVREAGNDNVINIDIYDATAGKLLGFKNVYRKEFAANYTYQDFSLDFDSTAGHKMEFRTWWHDRAYIKLDKIVVTSDTPPSPITPTPTSTPTPTPQTYTWEATDPALFHQTGRAEGTDWSANTAADGPGFLNFGPYYAGFEGGKHYRVTWKLLIDVYNPGYNDNVLNIDIYDATAGKLLGFKNVYRNEFTKNFTYQDFSMDFDYTAGHKMEFRTWWHDRAYIKLDKIVVTK